MYFRGYVLATSHFQAAASAVHASLPVFDAISVDQTNFLAKSDLFTGLSRAECLLIAQSARIQDFSRNDFIFEQGQAVRNVLLILSGSVKLTQLSYAGSEVILWLRGPGEAVGVFGIPSQARHTCSARIMVNCRILSWDWAKLDGSPSGPKIRQNIGRIVSERIGELEERFREIATDKVSMRVGCALLRILKQVGVPARDGVEVFLSREELAQLSGTTLFTVSRLMSKWSEQRLVEPRREVVLVRDPARLLQVCRDDD